MPECCDPCGVGGEFGDGLPGGIAALNPGLLSGKPPAGSKTIRRFGLASKRLLKLLRVLRGQFIGTNTLSIVRCPRSLGAQVDRAHPAGTPGAPTFSRPCASENHREPDREPYVASRLKAGAPFETGVPMGCAQVDSANEVNPPELAALLSSLARRERGGKVRL